MRAISQNPMEALRDIASVAYGSGMTEGAAGGAGRMGLVKGADGQPRVIKFNTHIGERLFGPKATKSMFEASKDLRDRLLGLADDLHIDEATKTKIKKLLGYKGDVAPKSLLNRKIVAKVVTMIGGNDVWEDVRTRQMAEKSSAAMNFDLQKVRGRMGCPYLTAKTVDAMSKLGLTEENLAAAIDSMATKYNLSGPAKETARRITFACLASRLEENEEGCGISSGEDILTRISKGEFTGSQIALLHLRVIGSRDVQDSDSVLIRNEPLNDLLPNYDERTCEFAAYAIGKFVKPNLDDLLSTQPWHGPSVFLMTRVMSHKVELINLREQQGVLSFDEMSRVIGAESNFVSRTVRQYEVVAKLSREVYDLGAKIGVVNKDEVDYMDFVSASLSGIEQLVAKFGLSPEDAVRQVCGKAGSLEIHQDIELFSVKDGDMGKTLDGLIDQLQGDINRSSGSIKVGDELIEYDHGPDGKAKAVVDAFVKLLGGTSVETLSPEQLQRLKMLLIASAQGGSQILQASGQILQIDHVPTEKTFTRRDDGAIEYTVKGNVDKIDPERIHKGTFQATCEIQANCENRLTSFVHLDNPSPQVDIVDQKADDE